VHGIDARNLSVYLSLSQLAKTLCFFFVIAYAFSSTKLEKGQIRFWLEVCGGAGGGKRDGAVGR
jgi:hypothetical protein